jgi:hypothetical protein
VTDDLPEEGGVSIFQALPPPGFLRSPVERAGWVLDGTSKQLLHERREAIKRAENLDRRIATHLRASLDFTNERLADFGIKPRPRVTRPRTKRRKEPGAAGDASKASSGS